MHSAPRNPASRPGERSLQRVVVAGSQPAGRGAPPCADRLDAGRVGYDNQPLHQVWQQVEVAGRLFSQIHNEVGAT